MIDGSGPNERILVALRQSAEGSVAIELLQQHYGEGIGWFNQRSLSLDPLQLSQLQTLLGQPALANRLCSTSVQSRDVLPFPGPRERSPQRPATGSF
jgi:hypothetical protein